MWKVEYLTGMSPTDADAIAAATLNKQIEQIQFESYKSLNNSFDSYYYKGFPNLTNIPRVVEGLSKCYIYKCFGVHGTVKHGVEISHFIRWYDNIWIDDDMLDYSFGCF